MAREPDKRLFERLLDRFWPMLRDAFMAAINSIRSNVVLRVLAERLERGDVQGAVEALQIDSEAFGEFEMALLEAYNAGGTELVGNLPRLVDPEGNRVVFRFGVRNLEAEAWLREHSSTLVTRIVEDQRLGIRTALTEGLASGQNPRATALNVVGRINRVTGNREGGIIGMASAQERYVASARSELLSGDPDRLRHYLTRERRDRRFDRAVLNAIRTGRPLDQDTVNRMVGRYADRLLQLRGEMLARTETMISLGRSRDDAIRQQIAAGKFTADQVVKIWRSAGDGRVRHTHRALNGTTVGFEGRFQSPSGAMLRHPGDPDAPISETSGCRCWCEYKISFFDPVVERFRRAA